MRFIELNEKNLTKVAAQFGITDPIETLVLVEEMLNPELEHVIVEVGTLRKRAEIISERRDQAYQNALAALRKELALDE